MDQKEKNMRPVRITRIRPGHTITDLRNVYGREREESHEEEAQEGFTSEAEQPQEMPNIAETEPMTPDAEAESMPEAEPKKPKESVLNKFRGSGLFFKKKREKSSDDSYRLVRFLNVIINVCVHLSIFLIPLFFLPVTVSPVELNKLALLIVLVGLAGVSWIGRMVTENELQLKRSFLSVPLLVFTAAYVLSSVFSMNRENSVWGYFGGESSSLTALIFFVLLFYVISNNFSSGRTARLLIINLLISSSIAFIVADFYMFGIEFLKFSGAEGKGFNTIGNVFSLATYAGSLLVFSAALVTERVKGRVLRTVAFTTAILSLITVTLVNYKLVWLILVIVMALLMTVGILRNTKHRSGVFIFPTIIFIFCLFGFFMKKPIVPVDGLPSNVSLSYKATIEVAWSGVKERFLFGSGPNNFSYLYSKNKGNMGNLASLNFDQGISFASTLLGTGGMAVFLSYLFLVFVMGRYAGVKVYKTFFGEVSQTPDEEEGELEEKKIITPASLLWLFVTLMLFLTTSSLALMFVWWLAFAILDALSDKNKVGGLDVRSKVSVLAEKIGMRGKKIKEEDLSKVSLIISLMFVGIITGFIAVVYVLSQKYIAAAYFQEALKESGSSENPNLESVGDKIAKAIYYNGSRDQYYSSLSDVFLLLANKRIADKGKDIGDEDRSYIWTAVDQGTRAAGGAIAVDRNNYNNYVKLGSIYEGIIGLVDGVDQSALENFEKARDLSPYDPYIYNQIARIYLTRYDIEIVKAAKENNGTLNEIPDSAKENLKRAEENLNKSLEIYSGDQAARLMLASVYELKGDLKGAIKITEENLTAAPSNFNLALGLSLLYYKDKNYDEAIGLLEQVVKIWDKFSDARYVLGLSYVQKGDLAKAKEQFAKVLELNPDNADVKRIVADLNAGRTDFMRSNTKVEEVQQKIEEEQKQQEQKDKTILNQGEQASPAPTPSNENAPN